MMVFYTDRFVPTRFSAYTRGPFIFIRPAYRGDRGLLEHERVHVRQWLRSLGLHALLYLLWHDYRLRCEVEAYQVQAAHSAGDIAPVFARLIATKYRLKITEHEALRLLRENHG